MEAAGANQKMFLYFLLILSLANSIHCASNPNAAAPMVKCHANETLNRCGNLCEPKCGNANPICPEICKSPACVCAQGFLRNNETGRCVSPEDCPNNNKCPPNEVFKECASHCEPKCGGPQDMMCIQSCAPAQCQCKSGFRRNQAGQCVPPEDCDDGVPTNPCAATDCLQGFDCVVVNGKAQCVNQTVCRGVECPRGEACRPHQVVCVRAPCPPIPQCVPVCQGFICPRGQVCVARQVQCFVAPCNDIPECVPQSGSAADSESNGSDK